MKRIFNWITSKDLNWASFSSVKPSLTQGFLGFEPSDWDLCRARVREFFAAYLSTDDYKIGEELIYLDHNTTAVIQRIITCARSQSDRKDCVLLTTDAEYPGIIALLDEQWHGPVFVACIARSIAEGKAERAEALLIDAVKLTWPDVVLLSHVTREAGFRIADNSICGIRAICPEAIIILDGAQACGNVHVKPEVLKAVDFYVTSGQKWLMGEPSLGLAVVHEQHKDIVVDPAQSYARRLGNGGTGNIRSLNSLLFHLMKIRGAAQKASAQQRIEEHNQEIARNFIDQAQRRIKKDSGFEVIQWGEEKDQDHRCGIVTFRCYENSASWSKASKSILGRLCKKGTQIKIEAWRQMSEGVSSLSGRRYAIRYASADSEQLVVDDFIASRDCAGSVCAEGMMTVRLSLHGCHGSKYVDKLLSTDGT